MSPFLLADTTEFADPKLVWRVGARLLRRAGILGLSLLLALAVWLLVRRQTGALERPLDSSGLLAAAFLLGLWSASLRWAWCVSASDGRPRPRWTRHVFGILTATGVLMFAVALSLPGSPAAALVAFWCLVLGGEAVGGLAFHIRRKSGEAQPAPAVGAVAGSPTTDTAAADHRRAAAETLELVDHAADEADGELLAADELQRMSRVRDPQGGELVSGLVRCCFDAGERQRNVHLAFCPPLKKVAHFSLEQVAGPVARIRTSLVETFGAGLEVKLNSLSSEPTSVQIQFFACEEPLDDEGH